VHDPVPIRVVQRAKNFASHAEDVSGRERARRESVGERLPFEVLEYKENSTVRPSNVEQSTDVWMIEAGYRP
jgi:hypothetical protein